jgi:hypothetical protein
MVPLFHVEKNSTTVLGYLYPDPKNPGIMIVKLRNQELLNVKDIPDMFGQTRIAYKDSVVINEQEFVNEFKIVGWYYYGD